MDSIYLDACATTRLDREVQDEMVRCATEFFANPSSQHRMGQLVRRQIEQRREQILSLIGAPRGAQLVFTSGGTEANNLAIQGIAKVSPESRREILISAIEHPSVVGAAHFLASQGFSIRLIPVNTQGIVNVEAMRSMLSEKTALVSVMMANNETGVIQPVHELAQSCREYDIPFHCDAIQAIGKIPVDFANWENLFLSIAPHKFHGPRGIGGLILPADLPIQPLIFGGFQQLGLRPGTEDLPLIAGFAKALERALSDLNENAHEMRQLRDHLEEQIQVQCPEVVINGNQAERAPHVSNMSFPGINRQALLLALDRKGIAVSTGSACASGSSDPSPVLRAMGLESNVVEGSLRVSLSRMTKREEIESAACHILNVVNHLRQPKRPGK